MSGACAGRVALVTGLTGRIAYDFARPSSPPAGVPVRCGRRLITSDAASYVTGQMLIADGGLTPH